MRRILPTINLTGILAIVAVADLLLYRLISSVFLPNQSTALLPRILSFLGLFCAEFSSLLALLILVLTLVRLLRDDSVFPGAMRITISTIFLFFIFLAGMGILSYYASPRYLTYLRISHAFLIIFLTIGIWPSNRPLRARLGITLLALPIIGQALALFLFQTGITWINPVTLARWGRTGILLFLVSTPLLFCTRPIGRLRWMIGIFTSSLVAGTLVLAVTSRFDLVQVIAFYGIRLDLTDISAWREGMLVSFVIAAYASLAFTLVTTLSHAGRPRLYGWGLVLIAASGLEITSPKLALFSLCGLLALAVASGPPQPTIEASAQN